MAKLTDRVGNMTVPVGAGTARFAHLIHLLVPSTLITNRARSSRGFRNPVTFVTTVIENWSILNVSGFMWFPQVMICLGGLD